ncbi:hypothetical protein KC953_01710 [Candidatus Saccharibacteria bacterium]|nr:hypothetical protein [Candidatus Saccharibacteria bacterium]
MSYDFSKAEFTPEGQAFIDARLLDQLTSMRDMCADYASKPNEKKSKLLSDVANAHLKSVRLAFEHIDDISTSDEHAITELFAYANGLEAHRVAFLNEIDGNGSEESPAYYTAVREYEAARDYLLGGDDLDEDDEEFEFDDDLNAIDHFYNLYGASLNVDLNQFASNCVEKYQKTPEYRRSAILRKLGSHALDIAKISAGVFIGVRLAKKK